MTLRTYLVRFTNFFFFDLNCYCRWWPPILFLMQCQHITYIQLMFIPLFSLLPLLYPCHQMRFCAKAVGPSVKCCLWFRYALMHVFIEVEPLCFVFPILRILVPIYLFLHLLQSYKANVICPNKHQSDPEKFYKNHLLESETYIGGHVECLESGVFRSDIPCSFTLEPSAFEVCCFHL